MNKRTESSHSTSELRFYEIIQHFADPILFLDSRLYIRYANKAFTELFGCDYQDVISRKFVEFLVAGENVTVVLDKLQHVVSSPDAVADFEVSARNHRESLLHLEVSAKSICNQLNEAMVIVHLKDVTGRKHAEEEKRQLQAQLHQAQKMESVGRLAGGVAHDFNNMLLVILAHAELLDRKIPPGDPLHTNLDQIKMAAERSADLTHQLLAFARKQVIAPKLLDLNQTIDSLLKMLRCLVGENIDLLWKPGETSHVFMDPSQLHQILVNLCVNARDAMNVFGKIKIETGKATFQEQECAAEAGCLPGEFAVLAVSDEGCGMDNETLSHIFEPFFTTKEIGKGTGLGLSIVYGIVNQNHGFIDVQSEPGQGTTFKIHLPSHELQETQAVVQKDAASLHGSGNILVVEDEPAILDTTREMLEVLGYRVLTAATPSEALRAAREHQGEIHLLITDIVMPEMNGYDLAQHLVRLHPNLKQLFMSGYASSLPPEQYALCQEAQFLQKPFSMRDLAAKIKAILEC